MIVQLQILFQKFSFPRLLRNNLENWGNILAPRRNILNSLVGSYEGLHFRGPYKDDIDMVTQNVNYNSGKPLSPVACRESTEAEINKKFSMR